MRFGLREPIGDHIEHGRVVAEAAMAALDLDVLARRPFALEDSPAMRRCRRCG
jgi:hypothetical protein